MTKTDFIALANELLQEENLATRQEDLQRLKREYRRIANQDEESFFDKKQSEEARAVFAKLAEKDPNLNRSAEEEKKAIIAAMKKLLERNDILAANKDLDVLTEDFKKAGRSATKEIDDALWDEFRKAKDEFYAKKKAYFEALDASNAEKKAKKLEIIEKAKLVLEKDNIKEATEEINALREEWKKVGYSGKDDEGLWKQFAAVLDEFSAKRKQHKELLLKQFEERAQKKEELILAAKKLLANSDFSPEEVEKVKALRGEYKAIGFAGREKDDDLYLRFNEVISKYFEEKKFYQG